MKKRIILMTLLLPLLVCSQNRSDKNRQEIEEQKIAFITKRIDLSSTESQSFWPIYNKFHEEVRIIRSNIRELTEGKDRTLITENEMGNIIDLKLKMEQEILDLKKDYTIQLQRIISNKKISALYTAEEEFKKNLLRRIKDNNRNKKR